MKRILWFVLVFLITCNVADAQCNQQNLSAIFKYHQEHIYGFAGDNYQRMVLHYDTIYQNEKERNYILEATISYKDKQLMAHGYIMPAKEQKMDATGTALSSKLVLSLSDSSRIEGSLVTLYYKNGGEIAYDDRKFHSDSFMNNYFVGSWIYGGNKVKCCWGEYRIPESGDLDIGAGEFSPNDKYLKNGWENIGQ